MSPEARIELIRSRLRKAATSAPRVAPVGVNCAAKGLAPLPRKRPTRFVDLIPKKEHGHGIKFSGDRFRLVHVASGIVRQRNRSSHLDEPRSKGRSPLTMIAEKWED